jgi:hypothetical protein
MSDTKTEETRYTEDEWKSILGEGIHVAFRKGSDHPEAHDYWKLIQKMPDELWDDVLGYVVWSLSYMNLIDVKPDGA